MGIPGYDKLKDREKVVALESRIQFQNTTIEHQKAQIEELKTDISQRKENVDNFLRNIQNQTGIIAEQQSTLKDQETTILQQQMSISELQKRLIDLQKKLEAANTDLFDMDEKVREKTENLRTENLELKESLDEKQREFNKKVEELDTTNKMLRDRIVVLEKREKEYGELTEKISTSDSSSLESRILEMEKAQEEANSTISKLEKEIQNTKENMESEIQVRDLKIKEYENLIKKQGLAMPTDANFVSDTKTAATVIRDIFARTKSNVMIFLPNIDVLNDLDFENLRSTTRVQIATPTHKNMELVNQLIRKPNIEIRNYTEGAIWGIIRDNEELLLAPMGDNLEPSGLIVKGTIQIDMFGTIMRATWTRLKRV